MDEKKVLERKRRDWDNISVNRWESFGTTVKGYHKHNYYEINLILSGEVKILFADRVEDGFRGRIVLTRPETPHYVKCDDDVFYKRMNLRFTNEFIDNRLPEWNRLSLLFGSTGNVFSLTEEDVQHCVSVMDRVEKEKEPLSARLLAYYLLSRLMVYMSELNKGEKKNKLPSYVIEAMSYIESNYSRKFSADDIARELHIGRTTLLTGFKKYTGITFGEYSVRCRLNHAIELLSQGQSLEHTAHNCGFADKGGLIRSFKRYFDTTPYKYVSERIK